MIEFLMRHLYPRFEHRVLFPLRSLGVPVYFRDFKLLSLYKKHHRQRAFIIGNGPSLTMEDLETLAEHHEITFASNGIYLAFDSTSFRPTYFSISDILFMQNKWDKIVEVFEDSGTTGFFPSYIKKHCDVERFPKAYVFQQLYEDRYPNPPHFNSYPIPGFHGANTVTYLLMQIAFFMGIKRIYLIGVDWDYKTPKKIVKDDPIHTLFEVDEEKNHFHADYLKKGELMGNPNLHRHEKAYLAALQAGRESGVEIFNATRGGKLEVFERVQFDDLFS